MYTGTLCTYVRENLYKCKYGYFSENLIYISTTDTYMDVCTGIVYVNVSAIHNYRNILINTYLYMFMSVLLLPH